jgi:hypothetical protein
MAQCADCTFDGMAIHWYGGKSFSLLTSWWNTEHTGLTGGFDDFKPFVESAKKFNLPIYLTGKAFHLPGHCTLLTCVQSSGFHGTSTRLWRTTCNSSTKPFVRDSDVL